MSVRVVRLGTPRLADEGVRIGTVRRPPRGVARSDFAKRDFFDVWLPELAPSPQLFASARSGPLTAARWKRFAIRYLSEMRRPEARHLIATLAALSHQSDFSVGCYCEDASHCHRSLLRDLLVESGAHVR
ncbi:MAG: DUF488 family protein [Gemmatimonadaceae bacterium]